MKVVEALKKIKDLKRGLDDYKTAVGANCALSNLDTPKYGNQREQVSRWIQAHRDTLKEISRLKTAVTRTNLTTDITIELGGKQVTKSIYEWVIRRRELAVEELEMWSCLTDRNIKEGIASTPTGEKMELKIVRFYDPAEKDRMRGELSSEPSIIDGKLEIVNAITDLIE